MSEFDLGTPQVFVSGVMFKKKFVAVKRCFAATITFAEQITTAAVVKIDGVL